MIVHVTNIAATLATIRKVMYGMAYPLSAIAESARP
jgi:hypothetical protein